MANISHLYYYLLYFVTFLERLRNISLTNLVKQPINRTCLSRILQSFPRGMADIFGTTEKP